MIKNLTKRSFGIFSIPAITFIIIWLLCWRNGISYFGSISSYNTFFRATATVMLTTFALSTNLNSGRFDFSLGSMALLSSVISATICIEQGYSAWTLVGLSLLIGAILGIISGLVYITVKLPAIIVSLGITLFFEGAAFAYTNGYGVSFVSISELTSFPSVLNYSIIIVLSIIFMVLVFDFTKFGYDYKALLSGQKVAVHTGVKEKLNAVICYCISGALMGVVGAILATNTGTIQMSLNFGSIAIMFTAFLPMFIGGFIGRFCNDKIGYVLGAVTMAFISLGYARLDVSSSVQQLITALLLVGFLIYLSNEKKILGFLSFKR